MKNLNRIIPIIAAVLLITMFSSACYDPGDAVVTINIERNDLASMGIQPEPELGIIDRILNLFSTRAEAFSWTDYRTNMVLKVTSGTIGEKIFTLPEGATSFTTTLPSGSDATFTITTESGGNLCWGGEITKFLGPGEQEMTIQMKPMSWIYNANSETGSVNLNWIDSFFPAEFSISSYNIYRSESIDGKYDRIAANITSFTDTTATGLISGRTYYYKISTNSIYGESPLSNPSGPATP